MQDDGNIPREARTERTIRAGLLSVVIVGVRRRNPGAVLNGLFGFAASYLPDVLERRYAVDLRPWQRVYVETALLTHAVGMLRPYDDTWWWDNLTHVHSATLVGGFAHVLARRRGRDPRRYVIVAVGGGGVLWEAGEYLVHAASRRLGVEPFLVTYGPRDTFYDLVSDLVGAVVVLVVGDRFLANLAAPARSSDQSSDETLTENTDETTDVTTDAETRPLSDSSPEEKGDRAQRGESDDAAESGA